MADENVVKCIHCNKPLTDPESIKLGIGPLCRARGWTKEKVDARMAELKRDAIPEGWVKLADVADALKKEGIPVTRMVRAIGGDRGMEEPVSPMFQVVYVGRSRYLPPESLSPEGLNLLRDKYLGKPKPEPKPRAKKEKAEKPAKKEKAAKAEPVVQESNIWES